MDRQSASAGSLAVADLVDAGLNAFSIVEQTHLNLINVQALQRRREAERDAKTLQLEVGQVKADLKGWLVTLNGRIGDVEAMGHALLQRMVRLEEIVTIKMTGLETDALPSTHRGRRALQPRRHGARACRVVVGDVWEEDDEHAAVLKG